MRRGGVESSVGGIVSGNLRSNVGSNKFVVARRNNTGDTQGIGRIGVPTVIIANKER